MKMLGKLIKHLRVVRDLSQADLAKLCGWEQGRISHYETGRREPGIAELNTLSKALKVPVSALVDEKEGDFLVIPEDYEKPEKLDLLLQPIIVWDSLEDLPEDEFVLVDKLDVKAAAGNGYENSDWPTLKEPLAYRASWVKKSKAQSTRLIVVTVTGESMLPTLSDGDDALIDLSQTEIFKGQVYAFIYAGAVKIKRIYKNAGKIILHSDNSYDPQYKYDDEINGSEAEHIKIIGRVVNRSGSGGL